MGDAAHSREDDAMRIHQPMPVLQALDTLLASPDVADAVVTRRILPARPADLVDIPSWLDPRLRGALEGRGMPALYRHQAEAMDALRRGEDVLVATPTASGKSLCYHLPVLQAVAEDPAARALYLFPTKALGRDQLTEIRELGSLAELQLEADVYDGDTPAGIRSRIRAAGQVVVTNPDMLHAAILPHHTAWFQLFEQLRYVVIDEAHGYRGIFGSHVANVLRRLARICAHYGSDPRIVCCSATIGNPAELGELLIGRPLRVIDRNGAPTAEKHVVVLDPPVRDVRTGVRPGASGLARRAALTFLRAGRQTIVFGRSRVQVELLLTSLREAMRDGRGPIDRVRGYRGGYLPSERRAIEAGLRTGDILGVVSTNALELGIDIGRLEVAVLAGYPGTITETWQRIGRAGRRQGVSAAVVVTGASPLDRYVAANPAFLFEGLPEEARLDPDNIHVLLAHIRAAAFELPFEAGEAFGPGPADDLLAFLAEEGHVRQADDGRWYWASENFPASEISLRAAAPENVVIIDETGGPRPRVIGEVDLFAAPTLVHENAIYLHESRQYHVDRLEWEERRAYVRPIDVEHYTQAELSVTLKPLDAFDEAPLPGARRVHGEVMVSTIATLFKKLKLDTHENLGWGRIHLPEIELQTTAWWLTLDEAADGGRRDELDVALVAAGRALQTVACVLLMSDPHDLGMTAQVRSPHAERPVVYLWESVPGGVGLSARLFERTEELLHGAEALVAGCDCDEGCPACVGPHGETGGSGRTLALRLLRQ
ncbi:MAG: DEAD/DEAH box helicase, partial [Candidatus Limnocylindrales bacterium]